MRMLVVVLAWLLCAAPLAAAASTSTAAPIIPLVQTAGTAPQAPPPPGTEELELQALVMQHLKDDNKVELIRLRQRLLLLEEARLGMESPQVAFTLGLLASDYSLIGREDLARPLRARAEAISRKPGFVPLLASSEVETLINTVYGRLLARDFGEAEAMMRRALALLEAVPGTRQGERSTARIYLGDALTGLGRFAEAEDEYADALHTAVAGPAADPASRIFVEQRLFQLYATQGRNLDAERKIAEIVALIASQGRLPSTDESMQFGDYYAHQGRYKEALEWKFSSMQSLYKRHVQSEQDAWGEQVAAQRRDRWRFMDFLSTTTKGFEHLRSNPRLMGASFEVAQLAQASNVGLSVERMALRHAADDDGFVRLLRAQQDALAALAADEQALGALLGDPRHDPAALAALRARIARAERAVAESRRAIATGYPRAQALVSQAPLSGSQVEPLLRAREALVVYVVDRYTTYAWVLNKDSGQIGYMTMPLDREALEHDIAAFRAKLVSGETGWIPRAMSPADGVPLYKALVAPLQPWLQGVGRILLVADGPLQGLPFAALADGEGDTADWLGKRYAFSALPSVGSLRALRGIASPRPPGLSFAGFGDPMLAPTGLPATGLTMRSLYGTSPVSNREGRLVDPTQLRELASLPDTGIELKAVARLLDAPAGALHLGRQATETQVKRLSLDRYRILSFATHGVMAGELAEGIEPGLILTPPDTPSQLDDGYLSASEAAQLKLDADWVLLSACNTAASDGTPDAEGLSGLANAFLYAGARALLVSHWRVSSDATTKLMAETIAAYAKAPQAGKAAALQAAMIATMRKPEYAHPYFWASFSLIGD